MPILYYLKVEEADDIPNIPAIGGSKGKEENSTPQNVSSQDKALETGVAKIDVSELPPHIVLEMPALSPTMVRTKNYRFWLWL